jgi:purine-binding chemotaxis protein CheW
VEWEENGPEWSFGARTEKEDDFYELVTEELYMREFGRREDERGQQLELLSFRLAREVYAVRLTSIKQIIKLVPITHVPRSPEYVLGIISLRGTVIPIFDLRKRLLLPASPPSRRTRIIVVTHGVFMVGLIVDEVEQVVRISAGGLEPPPSVLAGVEAEFIEGIGRSGDKMIILLALDKIMTPVAGVAPGQKTGT